MIFKKVAFILLVSLFVQSCSNNPLETIEIKDEEGSIIETFQQRREDGVKEGVAKKYYKDGTLMDVSKYENGVQHGERTMYDSLGTVEAVETYDKGILSGNYVKYHKNGQIMYVANYVVKNGISEREGEEKHYFTSGALEAIVNFKKNVEHGPFEEYHENGNIAVKGVYREGNESGLLEKYDEKGVIYQKMECENGRCVTIWKREE